MGPNRNSANPFLGSPASFERLDNSFDSKPQVSALDTTPQTLEIKSNWESYLEPTVQTESSIKYQVSREETNQNGITSHESRITNHETNSVQIGGMTEISFSSFSTQMEEQQETVQSYVESTTSQQIESGVSSIPNPVIEEESKPSFKLPVESTITGTIDVTKKISKTSFKTGKDVKVAVWDLFKTHILFKVETKEQKEKKAAEAAKKEEAKKKAPLPYRAAPGINPDALAQRAKQAEDINRKLRSKNLSYQGVLNSDGSVRADVQVLLDKVNSELQEAEIKKKKEAAMQAATGNSKKGAKGPKVSTNLNLSAEDPNNVSKLLG